MKKLLILLLLPCITSLASGQTRPPAYTLSESTPAQAGFASNRLQRIDSVVNDYVKKGWIAGATAIIVRHGHIVYNKAFGYDDIDRKTPLRKDAIFRIASQTKAITTTAVMILYEEGKILLDDPISKYIPAFSHPQVLAHFNPADSSYTTVPARSEISIRQLITHTSGLDYAEIGSPEMKAIYAKNHIPSGVGTDTGTLATEMQKLGRLPLAFQPGEKWNYSLGIDVLGYLVEVVSGMPLDRFLQTRIFDVLGMKDTYFFLPAAKRNRLATLYTEDSEHRLIKYHDQLFYHADYPKQSGTYFSGGAGLCSTMYDYAIFLQTMLNGGIYNGKRLLSPNTVRLMTTNQIGQLNNGYNKFGLGFGITSKEGAAIGPENEGTFSWGGYFGTSYWADPKAGLLALFMTQQIPDSHGDVAVRFKNMVYAALEAQ